MRPVRTALFCLSLLGGTETAIMEKAALAQSCIAEKITTLPLRNTGYSLTIAGFINDKPISFIVDTGSEGSLLTPEGLNGLSLSPPTAQHHATIIGADGQRHNVPLIPIKKLTLGTLNLTHRLFPLGDLPGIPLIIPPVWGLLGMDVLGHYDLDIDLPHGKLTLWNVQLDSLLCRPPPYEESAQGTDDQVVQQTETWQSFTPHIQNRRFALDFILDGTHGLGLLDTGARSHILSKAFAHKIGVSDAALALDPGGINSGISAINTTNARLYHWHRFRALTIGHETFPSPVLTVSQLHAHTDMLIGADYFLTHRVWLSPATQKIYLQTIKTPHPLQNIKKSH